MRLSIISLKELDALLRDLGFFLVIQQKVAAHLVYKLNSKDELIILPRVSLHDKISEIHLLAVKKSLLEMGLIESESFEKLLSKVKQKTVRPCSPISHVEVGSMVVGRPIKVARTLTGKGIKARRKAQRENSSLKLGKTK